MLASAPWSLRAQGQAGPGQTPVVSIASLTEAGESLAVTQVAPETGWAAFASARGQGLLLPAAASDTAADRASLFIDLYGSAFGLAGRSHVRLARPARRDGLGLEHVRFDQLHQGVPVTGAQFLVHLNGARVMAANGRVLDRMPVEMAPSVLPNVAQGVAAQVVGRFRPASAAGARYSAPRLEVFNRAFLEHKQQGITRIAWFIEATGRGLREFIWIDARTGGLLLNFSQLDTAKDREVYNANGLATLPGTLARSEGQPPTGNIDVDDAYGLTGAAYDFFFSRFGRDSFDGDGGTIVSSVNWNDGVSCPNAFWDGSQLVYCLGFASADDVVAHELTHAVTEYTAGLFYFVQSGALNESFSDIFGETIDLLTATPLPLADTPANRWLVGEDLPIGAIRDMEDPTVFSNPGRMSDVQWFWCDTTTDGGGVHTNSGVPNHAYQLMVDGGTYNGHTVTGIGLEKAVQIQYRALYWYLSSSSGFLDAFNALNQSCNDLVGSAGITFADCTQVQNALLAVEMHAAWGCINPQITTPALCPAGGVPTYVLQEGFEAGGAGWSVTSTSTAGWRQQSFYVEEGLLSFVGEDPAFASDHSLRSPSVVIPAGGRMIFTHAYDFDLGSDGGVIEYSTDGGTTWLDAGGLIDSGLMYDGVLTGAGNPLQNRQAFTAMPTYGYRLTRLNLAAFSGQTRRFRWRVGTDTTVGGNGWFVDSIKVYSCPVPVGAPVITAAPLPQFLPTGVPASFTVTATGFPTLKYQWSRNGSPIPGATTNTLTIPNVQWHDYGFYSVTVSNDVGTATSDGAVLVPTALGPPTFVKQPQNRTITTGQSTAFAADDFPMGVTTDQWQVSTNGGGSWADLADDATYSGVTSTQLVVTNAGVGLNGYLYRVLATNVNGPSMSDAAQLRVLAANLITNGAFSVGTTFWSRFETPPDNMEYQLNGGVFEYNRVGNSSTQSVIYQATGVPILGTPLQAQFDVGNSSTVRKRISVLIIDADFSDITVCTFWIEPAAPLRTYRMRTHTTKSWTSAAIYFYAASTGSSATTGGFLRLDNVSLGYNATGSDLRTECEDPTAPAPPPPPLPPDGPNLIVGGTFDTFGPPWGTFGQVYIEQNNGVLEFLKLAGAPAGVVLQQTLQAMTLNQFMTATLDLGNSSPVRKRVTVIIHDNDFSDLAACTFWLPPGLPLSTFQVRMRATEAWTNATLSVYPATTGFDRWIRMDNVSLRRTPGATIKGTECLEPAEVLSPPAFQAGTNGGGRADHGGIPAGVGTGWTGSDPDWRGSSFARLRFDDDGAAEWLSLTTDRGGQALRWRRPIDLDGLTDGRLSFASSLTESSGSAEVQVSVDGVRWRTLALVLPGEAWTEVDVDLSAYAGRTIYLQFVHTAQGGESAVWRVTNVRVTRRE